MKRTSLLLAGGLGTRLNGREKALMLHQGSTLLERALAVLDDVSDEVIVSLRDDEQIQDFSDYLDDRIVVTDRVRNAGPLAGMLAGFERASGDYVFAVACDMPFLNEQLIDMMFNMVGEHDALVPISEYGMEEPLHAIYRRDVMLEAIEASLGEGQRSIRAPVASLENVLYLDAETIMAVDKDLKSFVNINTPSDVQRIINWQSDDG
ncbi:molybdenum cofactor guanylyltransferase [Methanolobus sp. WCC4]|uniref:molybdenum cofactor guanylyltransferase n=1 Tax=Methanolobus sp. WCC4 TaxID=3125784 RepID=UPI0030FC4806